MLNTHCRLFGVMAITLLTCAANAARTPVDFDSPDDRKAAMTFGFFGCNRIDQKDWVAAKAENPSSANIPQLKQNLADLAALSPNLVFFGGDLVMGYADDKGEVLRSQIGAWIDLVKTLPRSPKCQYVAIAGNHEVNRKVGETRLPHPLTDAVWSELVKSAGYIPKGAAGPTPESDPEDKLVSDQRSLNFSFDRGSVHFIVLNTDTRVSTRDPQTGETKIAMIPSHWLNADLDRAEKNAKINCVIVMGHRNVVEPAEAKGDAPVDPECAAPMIKSLTTHAKVRAYVCAHVHAFDITTIEQSSVHQLTFGNGGSKLEAGWKPARGRTFGFGYFKVYADGSLGVIPYLRPEPKSYLEKAPELVPAAKPEPELFIAARDRPLLDRSFR